MAYKTFTAGTLATASDVNAYLMNQSVMVFTNTTARDAALTSPTDGMLTFQTADDAFTIRDGGVWVPIMIAWKTYTPTVNNVTLGSGYTLSASYAQIGKTVIVNFSLLFGATTAITGDVNFSLPVNHANTNRSAGMGNGAIIDASPLTRYHASAYPSGTPSFAYVRCFSASGNYVTETALSSSVPITTYAVNDNISLTLIYQAA